MQYRGNGAGGEWEAWQNDITETGMQFTAIPGHNVYFRVRTKDRVDHAHSVRLACGNQGQSAELGPYTVELEMRKYYYFGGQRAAMRVLTASTNQVYYLHGDHLGSVSLTTDASGAVLSQARYMPYGEVRWESSASPTDYAFTGQRAEQGFGLLDFNARFYSQRLGRFISADSLIPNPGSATDFDRYAYAAGNPLRYIDPTGHEVCLPKHCEYMHDYDSMGREATLEETIMYASLTLEARFKIEVINQEQGIDRWMIENIEPMRRGAMFTWSLNRATSFDRNIDHELALIDLTVISANNLSTGLWALATGGDIAPVVGSGNAYSVAYETILPESAYHFTRSSQNYRANRALLADMEADPQFAQAMNELIPNLSQELYFRPNASPRGWTWHHVSDQPGVMQLIPRIQHESPLLQSILHPGGQGGFSLWP